MAHITDKQAGFLKNRGIISPDTKEHAHRLITYIKEGIPGCRMSLSEDNSDRIARVKSAQNELVEQRAKLERSSFSCPYGVLGDEVDVKYIFTITQGGGWEYDLSNPLMAKFEYTDENGEMGEYSVPTRDLEPIEDDDED